MIRIVLVSLALGAGCMKTSATYCATHGADDPDHCPVVDAGGDTCTTSNDCVDLPATLVCNTAAGNCVECNADTLQTAACSGQRPICDDNDACRSCRTHADCPSLACLPDGSCGDDGSVAFVDGTPGTQLGSNCTTTAPCGKVSDALGLTPPRPFVKITGEIDENVTISNRDVTVIAAPGARLVKGSGTLISITGTSSVSVFDLQIGDTASSAVVGVDITSSVVGTVSLHRVRVVNNSRGAIIVNGGTLSLQRSTVSDNVGGGIVVRNTAAGFEILNNFVLFNGRGAGSSTTPFGGILIELGSGPGRVEFNTIAYNASGELQSVPGIACFGTSNSATGNLVYANHQGIVAASETSQYGGNCQYGTTFKAASGNLGFRNPDISALDAHLTAGSPSSIRDAAGDCTPSTTTDHDGQPRPFGAACDLGADEFAP